MMKSESEKMVITLSQNQTEKSLSVTVVIIDNERKFLLQHRDKKEGLRYSDTWVFPGGGVEENESFKQTAIREMEEEFEMDIQENELQELGMYVHDNEEDHLLVYTGTSIPTKTNEGQEIKFYRIEDIESIKLGFGQQEILPLVRKFLLLKK